MTSARLVALVVLLSSLLVFAQDKKPDTKSASSSEPAIKTTSPEPWRIYPDLTAKADVAPDSLSRLQNTRPQIGKKDPVASPDEHLTFPVVPGSPMTFRSPGQRADDDTCLKIRSYQVARDSKDSDSTHFVGYSTCQPSSRYQLRTTVGSEKPAATK
jgi:hypothetical protein